MGVGSTNPIHFLWLVAVAFQFADALLELGPLSSQRPLAGGEEFELVEVEQPPEGSSLPSVQPLLSGDEEFQLVEVEKPPAGSSLSSAQRPLSGDEEFQLVEVEQPPERSSLSSPQWPLSGDEEFQLVEVEQPPEGSFSSSVQQPLRGGEEFQLVEEEKPPEGSSLSSAQRPLSGDEEFQLVEEEQPPEGPSSSSVQRPLSGGEEFELEEVEKPPEGSSLSTELQSSSVEQPPETSLESEPSSLQHPPDLPAPYPRVGSQPLPFPESSDQDHAVIDVIEPAPSQPSTSRQSPSPGQPCTPAMLGKTVLGVTFQAAFGLAQFRIQGSSSSSSSSSSYSPINYKMQTTVLTVAEVALALAFTCALIGLFMRSVHPSIAAYMEHSGLFATAVTFFSITIMFNSAAVLWVLLPIGIFIVFFIILSLIKMYRKLYTV